MIVFRGDNNRGQLGLVSPDEKCVRLPTKVSTFCDGRHISRLIYDSNYTYVLARKKRQRSTLRDKPGSIFTKPGSDSIYHLSCTKPGLVSTKLGSCST